MAADHYETLEVAPEASAAELRAAYLTLARTHHPDRFEGRDRHRAETRMQAINEAWNVLGTPHKRKEYDAGRRRSGFGSGATSAGHARRGRADFRPFDDAEADPNDDIDLDPEPIAGSRNVPRWLRMMPVVLIAAGIVFMAFGLLVNAAAIIAFAAVVFAVGGCGFLILPLIVMSRAERDPRL